MIVRPLLPALLQQKRKIVKLVTAVCILACSLDEEIKRVRLELNTPPIKKMLFFSNCKTFQVFRLSLSSRRPWHPKMPQRRVSFFGPSPKKEEREQMHRTEQFLRLFNHLTSLPFPLVSAAGDRIRTAFALRLINALLRSCKCIFWYCIPAVGLVSTSALHFGMSSMWLLVCILMYVCTLYMDQCVSVSMSTLICNVAQSFGGISVQVFVKAGVCGIENGPFER